MACPICSRPTVTDYRPFCSRRCADLDLGKWITGAYAIPSDEDVASDTIVPANDDEPRE